MSQTRFFFFISFFLYLLLVLPICHGLPLMDLNSLKQSEVSDIITKSRVCTGSIGECLSFGDRETKMMDSESNRRILAMQKKYISYGTLRRDMVPCDRPGASYYNCHAKPANPYHRGCEVITTCARELEDEVLATRRSSALMNHANRTRWTLPITRKSQIWMREFQI
ncbi:protein RALF-like 24 [Prosopis cineraria]|uniref:protein RALF-like 24 n=1 Tax=Prosopis cineraria TaxID=364024 RepID=UPI00240FE873|nr:protein RALF-like 24 [Prosopis cineraria]